jgi:stage V sporulation protein R
MDREVRELEKALEQIWEIATQKFGLDPYPTRFEIVPATVMYEVGSYALPGRYSHWSFGKAYHKMKTMYDFGLSKIYEVVINANPSYAFLLENNSLLQNKLVIAHVLGHVDFFKHSVYFSPTNRRMVDDAALHARRINEYEFRHGRKVVEEFLDAVLSIEEHIDPYFFIKKERERSASEGRDRPAPGRYDDLVSPEEARARSQRETIEAQTKRMAPEKDLVYYIQQHSPILEPWQRDVMSMIHDEMLYFVPQMQTKIMNEGWACATGDSLLLTERGWMRFDELYRILDQFKEKIRVASGGPSALCHVTDFHRSERAATIRVRTRRGLTIEGALKHRLQMADGSWRSLRDLHLGEAIAIEAGTDLWPAPDSRGALAAVASGAPATGEFGSARQAIEASLEFDPADETLSDIPSSILRSPKRVVSSFLRRCFDARAAVDTTGIRLSASSAELTRTIQIMLLNYGILSTRREDDLALEIAGHSAARFRQEIGFGQMGKGKALDEYLGSCASLEPEEMIDSVVSIETGCADVYDITVEARHSYVANGLRHHNSFWHSRIMRELDLPDHEHLEFAELHAGVVSPHRGQLNPYYLGYKIFEDIERRWKDDGRAKIFEVRELDNDVSFLRNYLTEELCEELDLFVYELVDEEEWTVTEKRWERVRDQLVANMTNFGFPYIEVVDGDFDRNRELYLMHRFEGAELDLKYARKVLEYVYKLWGRTVHLETKVDDEALVLHFDGEDHDEN